MSYINDALKRAQKERDNRYVNYGLILRPSTDRSVSRWKRTWVALAVSAAFLLAGGLYLLFSVPDFMPPAVSPPAKQTAQEAMPRPAAGGGAQTAGQENAVRRAPVIAPGDTRSFDTEKTYAKALTMQKKRRLSEAETLYKRIVAHDPAHVQSLNNLGVIYLGQGRRTLAEKTLRKALAIRKDYVDPYYNLACLYVQKRDLREGFRYLKKAAAVDARVKSWAREDADMRALQDLPEYRSFLKEE